MKLRNLMYATMIACAFASCSKDDETTPDNGGLQANGDATLEVNMNVASITKAINGNDAGDATINTLTLIVFDREGNAEAVVTTDKTNDGKGAVSVKAVVTSGEKKVTVLANAADILDDAKFAGKTDLKTSTLAELQALTTNFATEGATDLVMNSALSTVQLTAGVVNYLGYNDVPVGGANLNDQAGVVGADENGVKLYRNVAKVKLNAVTMDVNDTQYPNASFTITNVFLLHAKQSSKLFSETEWAATETAAGLSYHNGVSSTMYVSYVTLFKQIIATFTGGKAIFNYLENGIAADLENGALLLKPNLDLNIADGGSLNAAALNLSDFYAYENSVSINKDAPIYTLLVLEGEFTYGSSDKASERLTNTRYYSLAVGRTGKGSAEDRSFPLPDGFEDKRTDVSTVKDVLRNLQYNVSLKITGEGYVTPFGPEIEDGDGGKKAILDVQCTVAAWGAVVQDVEI